VVLLNSISPNLKLHPGFFVYIIEAIVMERKEEKLIWYLEQLPQAPVPFDFSFQVMDRIETRRRRGFVFGNFKKLAIVSLSVVFLAMVFLTDLPLFPQFHMSNFSGYRRVELKFCALSENAKTVAVAGDFSDWNALQMEKGNDNSWVITLKVMPGKYQYSFVIDGDEWVPDPGSPRQVEDGFGGVNSVLVVNGG